MCVGGHLRCFFFWCARSEQRAPPKHMSVEASSPSLQEQLARLESAATLCASDLEALVTKLNAALLEVRAFCDAFVVVCIAAR